MLRALWTWQRWIGVWRPKVLRIALVSALAPSMMNSRQTLGSRPRSIRLSSSACATAAFSVAPSITPRGCLPPAPSTPTAPSSMRSSSMWMPSIWITSRSSCDRSEAIHSFMRSADSATNRREVADLDRPAPSWAGTSPRQAHGAPEFARRHVDQHQVQGPLAEPILGHRCFPTRQRQLAAVAGPHARSLQRHFAAMEAQLSLGPSPAMSILAVPAIADPTEPGRIRLHHASQCRDARRQAESLKARSDLLPSLFNDCSRDNLGRCSILLHGVALLRGFSTPSLLAQGGQRLPHIFNISRDIPSPKVELLSLQARQREAKPYQISQFLEMVEEYGLIMEPRR